MNQKLKWIILVSILLNVLLVGILFRPVAAPDG